MLWQAAYSGLCFWTCFGPILTERAGRRLRNLTAASAVSGERPCHTEPDLDAQVRRDWSDLGAQIASGLVLAIVGVIAAWRGGATAGTCGAAVVVMSYEWARRAAQATAPAFLFALAGSLAP